MDFAVISTVTFQILFVFVALMTLERRRVVHKDAPEPRMTHHDGPEEGEIVAFPDVGGLLHHRYERRAA